jgi:nucleoside-diphosphate-sugar epimerase
VSRPAVVTGATGGLGVALVAALSAAGRPVVAVGRRGGSDPRLSAPGVRYVRADLSDRTLAQVVMPDDVGTVFHCAALSAPWGRRTDFEAANVDATRNVLHAARVAGADAFVHVSTPSVYAAMRDRVAITERDAPEDPPLGDYARTKLAAERLVLEDQGGMATVAVRPRAIVGPNDAVVLPRLIELVRRGRVPLVAGGSALVEFTDVRDVVDALLAAEANAARAAGSAVNVSGGRPITVRRAAELIAEAVGAKPRFVDMPLGLASAIARAVEAAWPRSGWAGEPAITQYTLATIAHSQTFDLSLARTLIDWTPRRDAVATLVERAEALR